MKLSGIIANAFILVGTACMPLMADQPVNSEVPVAILVAANSCVAQDVALTGTMHSFFTVNTNNNTTHINGHYNTQGVSGTGLTDGSKYLLVNGVDYEVNTNSNSTMEMTTTMDFSMIGQGQAANLKIRMFMHITVANGTVTTDVLKATTVCQ